MNLPFGEKKREVELFREVFGTDEGKEILAILARKFHVYKFMQTPDPYISAFQEGQRSVVVQIMEILKTDLDAVKRRLGQMDDERLKRRQ
tara:strand:+ start:3834 stop:4103 length:270 start_codon:yes stop_codon:yes gene_type:complete